ncbi:MAG TPA: hypothetical protein ENK06_01505 [Gammaproteobacteria bacterium]|nr:hypothetical protein [Gammaproteobacteria bacterium]
MPEVKKQVTQAEVSKLLVEIINGSVFADSLNDINWSDVNEPYVSAGDWEIQFFIEARWIYDVYVVIAPDGRRSDFSQRDNDSGINNFLNDYEVALLLKKLGCPISDDEVKRFQPEA